MKSLFAFVGVLALLLVTVLAYFVARPAAKRTSDWQMVKDLPGKLWDNVKALGTYITTLFSAQPTETTVSSTPAAAA